MTDYPFLALWDDCARRCAQALPQAVTDAARRSWFDTCAVMTAGVREHCARTALAAAESRELTSVDAALVLGTASHALDYDDVCMLATCHPSAPVVAGLFALLPKLSSRLTLGDLLAGYALGTETLLRLGGWLGFRHYALGFHATSTLGSIGAAAAAVHVLRLGREQAHSALSIAGSSACGLRANFGTDTKPLHVGFAAAAGVRAALLAQAGAQASNDVWGPSGFVHAFNGGGPTEGLPWSPGAPFALEQPGFELKRFPSCYMTHRLIAGVLALRAHHPDASGREVDIDVEMPHNGTAPLKHPQPATGLEAKFSGPYCAAAAWVDGKVELASFADAAVLRPALQTQMRRVRLTERTASGESLDAAPVSVEIRGAGFTDRICVDWAPGSTADPFGREELQAKWCDCVTHTGLNLDARAVLALLDAPLDTPAVDMLIPLRQTLLAACASAAARS